MRLMRILAMALMFTMSSCAIFTNSIAIDTAVVWADASSLESAYSGLEEKVRENKGIFEEDWEDFEEFDQIADTLVKMYNDIRSGKIETLTLEELEFMYVEAKKAYLNIRPVIISKEAELDRIDWIGLKAFDFKANQADKSITKLLSNGDATQTLVQIAGILATTLKIATIVVAL